MNRSIAYTGLLLVVGGILWLSTPYLLTSSFQVGPQLYLSMMLVVVGFVALFRGATSPDPSVTTVGGFMGNPIADEVRRAMAEPRTVGPQARYQPRPWEPVNCRFCYTAIPVTVLDCPRCGRRRSCRTCSRPLMSVEGALTCAQCSRYEFFCGCPKARPRVAAGPVARRAW